MDEREKVEEQVEDLPVDEQSAEDVKGGSLNFEKYKTVKAPAPNEASPQLGGGGWDANHSEILVRL
jgi:hypothetical protein